MQLVTRIYVNEGIIKLVSKDEEGVAITTEATHCMQVCPKVDNHLRACTQLASALQLAIPTASIMVASALKEVVEVAKTVAALVTVEVSNEDAIIVDKVLSAKGVGTRSLVRSAVAQNRFYKQLSASFNRNRMALMELKPEMDMLLAADNMALSDLAAAWKRFPAFKDGLPPVAGLGQTEHSEIRKKALNESVRLASGMVGGYIAATIDREGFVDVSFGEFVTACVLEKMVHFAQTPKIVAKGSAAIYQSLLQRMGIASCWNKVSALKPLCVARSLQDRGGQFVAAVREVAQGCEELGGYTARTQEKKCQHARQAEIIRATCAKIEQAAGTVNKEEWKPFMEACQMGMTLPKETAAVVERAIPSFVRQLLVAVHFPALVEADMWRRFASSIGECVEAATFGKNE
eukprot:6492280-Amphidinium_carterae.3